jgi:hypothetical protein
MQSENGQTESAVKYENILQPTPFDRKTTCFRKARWTVQN